MASEQKLPKCRFLVYAGVVRYQDGFSLVEVVIVLMVLGLLMGALFIINPPRSSYPQVLDSEDLQVTHQPGRNADPSWFPGSEKIAFYAERNDNADIYLVDLGSKTEENLTASRVWEVDPSVSPDGKYIVYLVEPDRDKVVEPGALPFALFVMNADGSNQRELVRSRGPMSASWHPSGKVCFVKDGDIFLVNRDGSGLTPLTDTPEEEYHPAFSPDGKVLVYSVITRRYQQDTDQPGQLMGLPQGSMRPPDMDLYVEVNGVKKKLVGGIGEHSVFQEPFTPDGRTIYYFVAKPNEHPHIRKINIDGTGDAVVVSSETCHCGDPAVSSDGKYLAYFSQCGEKRHIYVKEL